MFLYFNCLVSYIFEKEPNLIPRSMVDLICQHDHNKTSWLSNSFNLYNGNGCWYVAIFLTGQYIVNLNVTYSSRWPKSGDCKSKQLK